MTRKRLIAAGLVVVLAGVAAAFLLNREREYDPDFDTSVSEPAYRGGGPLVLYDEAHLNSHTADGGYKPLVELLRNDGYEVRILRQPLSASSLEGAAVLLIVAARGANDANDDAAFTEAETAAVDAWVRGGGSLLLVTDHWPYGVAAASLAQRFEVRMGAGLVEDPQQHDATLGASHLVFSADNGLLQDHPIVRGRSPAERVQRVLTFTGQSLLGPPDAVPFLALSDAAVEWQPGTPRVERDGGDVRVSMDYVAALPVNGRSQGIALDVRQGRVVILGEAGMLRAQRESGGLLVGMNVPGYDNRQLALNILHWLSRVP
jgi:hypothetical protein